MRASEDEIDEEEIVESFDDEREEWEKCQWLPISDITHIYIKKSTVKRPDMRECNSIV